MQLFKWIYFVINIVIGWIFLSFWDLYHRLFGYSKQILYLYIIRTCQASSQCSNQRVVFLLYIVLKWKVYELLFIFLHEIITNLCRRLWGGLPADVRFNDKNRNITLHLSYCRPVEHDRDHKVMNGCLYPSTWKVYVSFDNYWECRRSRFVIGGE